MRRAALLSMTVSVVLWAGPAGARAQDPVPECFGTPATIVGTERGETITGTGGNDVIVAGAGSDIIDAGAGNDLICAGPDDPGQLPDNDRVDAGEGDDSVFTGAGEDTATLGAGEDYATLGAGMDIANGGDGRDVIDGGEGADLLDGGPDDDRLQAAAGDDVLTASGGGADYLDAGEGFDTVTGGPETSYIAGGPGIDNIPAVAGLVFAGEGDDTITGTGTISYIRAGAGDDIVRSPTYLEGGDGADQLIGTASGAYLDGGNDDDQLTGPTVGGVYLDGGAGTDTLTTRGPDNTLDGGSGHDTLTDAGGDAYLDGGPDEDQLTAGAGPDTLFGDTGNDELAGGAGNDTLDGGDDNDTVNAGPGEDILEGGAGDDTINGGPDADVFQGGPGSDILRAVDGITDTAFVCGPVFENDRLVVDTIADAEVWRSNCEREIPRTYTPPVPPTDPPPLVGVPYAALGDSFSSGEGTYEYDFDTGELCHRGPWAWPRMVARRRGLDNDEIDHRACTGATTAHILGPWPLRAELAQLPRRRQTATRLVTLTIGGNDIDFGPKLRAVRISPGAVWPSPVYNRGETEYQINLGLQDLKRGLPAIYGWLRKMYPNARIVHVGYPRILPSLGEGPAYRCAWLSNGERALADWILNRLNNTIRAAATSSRFGIEYVDVSEALDGHELCTTDPEVNDLAVEYNDIPGFGTGGTTERGHPDRIGQFAYADAVADALE